MADTAVRLWHIGHYRYGWGDAGNKLQRYSEFTLNFPDNKLTITLDADGPAAVPAPKAGSAKELDAPEVRELQMAFAWPTARPTIELSRTDTEPAEPVRAMLRRALSAKTRIVVDLGASTGQVARFLAKTAPQAAVIAVDAWESVDQQQKSPSADGG